MCYINKDLFISLAIVLFAISPLLMHAEVEREEAADQARELIQLLAKEGSEDAYRELELFFHDADHVNLLFEGSGSSGVVMGLRSIRQALESIGDSQDERSYQLLLTFLNADYEKNIFEMDAYSTLISNLLKYRETKGEELTAILVSELDQMFSDKEAVEAEHPFLLDENVIFKQDRSSRYITEDGAVVYEGNAKPATSAGTILNGLYLIESAASYAVIKSFLTSWIGRETSMAFEYPEMRLKKRRYDLPVIDIYEALMRDTRYLKASRSDFVKHFFGNSVVHYAHIENPERDFAQIANTREDALLRILDVANYALSLDFLPNETVDLVHAKRAEIIDRLIGMGYIREELNQTKIAKSEAAEKVKQTEPKIEEGPEVVTAELTEEPVEQSTQWWLWLIGVLVAVGGIGLAVRRKS